MNTAQTNKQMQRSFPTDACIQTAARRLRYLRRMAETEPSNWGDDFERGRSAGYDDALRVMLDEFGVSGDKWWTCMYGPPGEYPEPSTNN